jgi:hypothetical protein
MNASARIAQHIESLADWRGRTLNKLRKLILDAAPELVEEWKWNTPLWSCQGNVLAAGAFKDHVKINFFKGALLADPKRLFNAGLDAKTSRSIDLHEGDAVEEKAFKELVRAAVALNGTKSKPARARKPATKERRR